ncbi:MAG TPA: DinB family protein [Bacteroidia bacterium]|nr:DinB family protein [Bacteroidia bacterium]
MKLKTILSEQFAATNKQKNWFASLTDALEGLTFEQACWKPEDGDHSILQIVNHLYYWNKRMLNRMQHIPNDKMSSDNNSTFGSENNKDAWLMLLEKSRIMMEEFENEIGKFDDAKLLSPVSDENKSPWYSVLSNTNLHNAYHIGQIVLLRKLQESWDSKKNGVN